MRANITKDGELEITSETETEAYALSKWLESDEFRVMFYVSADGFPIPNEGIGPVKMKRGLTP